MRLFKFWKRSKKEEAIKLAKKLRLVLIDLGYKKPKEGVANNINIWEFDNGGLHIEERNSNIRIEDKI